MATNNLNDFGSIAAAVRAACVDTAIKAYEDAGIRGLCDEGRWEHAVAAMRLLDLLSLKDAPDSAHQSEDASPRL